VNLETAIIRVTEARKNLQAMTEARDGAHAVLRERTTIADAALAAAHANLDPDCAHDRDQDASKAKSSADAAKRAADAADQQHAKAAAQLAAAEATQRSAINTIEAADADQILQRMARRAAQFEVEQAADKAKLIAARHNDVPLSSDVLYVICDFRDIPLSEYGRPSPLATPKVDEIQICKDADRYWRDFENKLMRDSQPSAVAAA